MPRLFAGDYELVLTNLSTSSRWFSVPNTTADSLRPSLNNWTRIMQLKAALHTSPFYTFHATQAPQNTDSPSLKLLMCSCPWNNNATTISSERGSRREDADADLWMTSSISRALQLFRNGFSFTIPLWKENLMGPRLISQWPERTFFHSHWYVLYSHQSCKHRARERFISLHVHSIAGGSAGTKRPSY